MMPRRFLVLSLIMSALPLAGCEATKEQMGLTRRSPDEFAVMTRAPLELPPDLNAPLPKPQPGAARPQEVSPNQSAEEAVLGQPAISASTESNAENALLQRAGAAQTDPNIRAIVNKEAVEDAKDNRPVVKRILAIGDKNADAPATIVDAPKELNRLKTNKQSGQPVTAGATPTLDD